jgi:hypothetical protein
VSDLPCIRSFSERDPISPVVPSMGRKVSLRYATYMIDRLTDCIHITPLRSQTLGKILQKHQHLN